jgi:hypothetical protein
MLREDRAFHGCLHRTRRVVREVPEPEADPREPALPGDDGRRGAEAPHEVD